MLMPLAFAIAAAVQCVISPGGGSRVWKTTVSSTAASRGGMREGRVLSRSSQLTPSVINRSCQRQTAVLLLPERRMISAVPHPCAVNNTMWGPPDMQRETSERPEPQGSEYRCGAPGAEQLVVCAGQRMNQEG
jgi:hypothetical protein